MIHLLLRCGMASIGVWELYYKETFKREYYDQSNPDIVTYNALFICNCRFENTRNCISVKNINSEILHSKCTFYKNILPVKIDGNCSIVQHQFNSVKSTNEDQGQHSNCQIVKNSQQLNYIDESSLLECGINRQRHITIQNYGVCRYKCTNSSSNQAMAGSAYTMMNSNQKVNISLSYFIGNAGDQSCLSHMLSSSSSYFLFHSNILDNNIGDSLIYSWSSIHIENCNIINNICQTLITQISLQNAMVTNCYIDKLTTSGSFVIAQSANQTISMTNCPVRKTKYRSSGPDIYRYFRLRRARRR